HVGGGLVAGGGDRADAADGGLALVPVLLVGQHQVRLGGEVLGRERAGAHRFLVRVGGQVVHVGEEVLGDDPGAGEGVGALGEGRLGVVDLDGRLVDLLRGGCGAAGVQRLGLVDLVEGEGDVLRGEGGVVGPDHA